MNLLLTGPPASGKSTAALLRFHSISGSLLLTPTATMAEHLRNEMARASIAVCPSSVLTLAGFLDLCAPGQTAPAPLVQLAIQDALEAVRPARYQAVMGFRGFRTALTQLFEEIPFDAPAEGLGELDQVLREAHARIHSLGFMLRKERLRSAAELATTSLAPHIVLDGFFSFSRAELMLVEALAARTQMTVVLPDVSSAASARERLLQLGFEWKRCEGSQRRPVLSSFQAASMDQEAEEIARRILGFAGSGCAFREMGIVLRSREPYGPIVETTLERFGIPVRSYFAPPLMSHPVAAYLSGLVRALLAGWDHSDLGALLRMPISGVGAAEPGDRFDFQLRASLPGNGLPLGEVEPAPPIISRIAEMNPWTAARLQPTEWAARLKALIKLIPDPTITGEDSRQQASAWTSRARASAYWADAMDLSAASCPDAGRLSLKQFWQRAESVLAATPLRIPDRRREAVALLDVFEARQWQLRVVFLCGLAERLFPHYHREDPILGDRIRARLGLPTAQERQREERFLFDLAASRATQETVLSYARFNEKGDDVLASFFLDHVPPALSGARMRPAPIRDVPANPPAPLQDPEQLTRLVDRHKLISPTSIEDFLQCPFLFFGRKTLRLKERPALPRDRLDVLAQGSILHRALAEWAKTPLFGAAILRQVFEDEVAQRRIPSGYRTEAVRLELQRHFEAFLRDRQVPLPADVLVEQEVRFALHPGLSIRGRIDRLDVGPGKQALVIDYKYSAMERIREKVEESEEGDRVQAGLYLLAAEQVLKLEPAGMLYCGLRKKVSWSGWHLNRPGMQKVGEARTPEALRELMESARSATLEAHGAILAGRVAAHPRDRDQCKRCNFRDICRVETLAVALEARG